MLPKNKVTRVMMMRRRKMMEMIMSMMEMMAVHTNAVVERA